MLTWTGVGNRLSELLGWFYANKGWETYFWVSAPIYHFHIQEEAITEFDMAREVVDGNQLNSLRYLIKYRFR